MVDALRLSGQAEDDTDQTMKCVRKLFGRYPILAIIDGFAIVASRSLTQVFHSKATSIKGNLAFMYPSSAG